MSLSHIGFYHLFCFRELDDPFPLAKKLLQLQLFLQLLVMIVVLYFLFLFLLLLLLNNIFRHKYESQHHLLSYSPQRYIVNDIEPAEE